MILRPLFQAYVVDLFLAQGFCRICVEFPGATCTDAFQLRAVILRNPLYKLAGYSHIPPRYPSLRSDELPRAPARSPRFLRFQSRHNSFCRLCMLLPGTSLDWVPSSGSTVDCLTYPGNLSTEDLRLWRQRRSLPRESAADSALAIELSFGQPNPL